MRKVEFDKSYMVIIFYKGYHKRVFIQCLYILERLKNYHQHMLKAEIYKYNYCTKDYMYMATVTVDRGLQ